MFEQDLINKIEKSTHKVNIFLKSFVKEEIVKISKKLDLACIFKLPMFFLLNNEVDLANNSLKYIYENYLQPSGDFSTTAELKSEKDEYIEFWTYFNGWILRAAAIAGYTYPRSCKNYFEGCSKEAYLLTNEKGLKSHESDILTYANYGMYFLETNKIEKATKCYNYIKINLENQSNSSIYYLRTRQGEIISSFPKEKSHFYTVEKKCEQLFFMLAYPCAFLVSYYKKICDKNALVAAEKIMEFLIQCDYTALNSRFSHKTAWALSLLYSETKKEKYLNYLGTIINYFLSIQGVNGEWLADLDMTTSLDQTAEIGCWFAEIKQNLTIII